MRSTALFPAILLFSQPAEQALQCFPFFSSGFLSPRLLLLGGGFSPFGVTTTVFGGLGGRSFRFCANAPVGIKQPIATATSFRFKSNIEFPILLMHYQERMGGRDKSCADLNRARTVPEMLTHSIP